jgi:hypothetical protein
MAQQDSRRARFIPTIDSGIEAAERLARGA